MLRRKISSVLAEWKKNSHSKALLVRGARQVGKSTSIRQFASDNYKHLVEINFERTPLARRAFEGNLDMPTIILNLSAMGFGPFVPRETLIFLDEIQSCAQARTAIKFMVEDGRFDIIESGSMLGVSYRDVSSYPVGSEHQVDMYPLDFEEFLWAKGIGENVVSMLRHCYETHTPVPDIIHEQLSRLLREFFIVGGMPEVVASYVESSDLNVTASIQSDIINSYHDDIAKYAGRDKVLARSVFDAIPAQLAKQNKRFKLSEIEQGASNRKYGDATQWLVDAGTAYYSFNTTALQLPFTFTEKRNLYKLFLCDTGLCSHLSLRDLQFSVLSGDLDINAGALAENFVATELVKHGHTLHYYDRHSRQELDFVLDHNGGLCVIEVKSGGSYRQHLSIDTAINGKHHISSAIVLCRGNVESASPLVYLPLYMAMFI